MSHKIYTVTFEDETSIYASWRAALKQYLISCIFETREIVESVLIDAEDSSDVYDASVSGVLKIYELDGGNEYELTKTYDIADFQEFMDKTELDVKDFLDLLEEKLEKDDIPDDLFLFFQA